MKAVELAWAHLLRVIYGSNSEIFMPKLPAIFYLAFWTFLPSRTDEHVMEMSREPPTHLRLDWDLIDPFRVSGCVLVLCATLQSSKRKTGGGGGVGAQSYLKTSQWPIRTKRGWIRGMNCSLEFPFTLASEHGKSAPERQVGDVWQGLLSSQRPLFPN